jgi:hypothetical protein
VCGKQVKVMEGSEVGNGFEVRVRASAPYVAAFVTDLENLPLWDPGCQKVTSVDAFNYIIHDKSFERRIWYTVKHATPTSLRLTGRGRGFVTRETITVWPDQLDGAYCYVRYTASVALRMPYRLCSSCVDAKLQRASTGAGCALQAYFERMHEHNEAREGDELLLFECEL